MAKDKKNGNKGEDFVEGLNAAANAIPEEFKDFQEENIQFPPYWNPSMNGWWYGMVTAIDDRDPEFPRVVVQAKRPLMCARGPADDAEEVEVKESEFFTLSPYAALPLERYIGVSVLVRVTGQRKVPGRPNDMWIFSLSVSPEDKKILDSERKERAQIAAQKYRESKMLKSAADTKKTATA